MKRKRNSGMKTSLKMKSDLGMKRRLMKKRDLAMEMVNGKVKEMWKRKERQTGLR